MQRIFPSLLMFGAALAAGCGGASFEPPQQARDPLLEKLKEPPLNLPATKSAKPSAVPQEMPKQTPALTRDQPGILVTSDGRLMSRALSLSGRVAHKSGLIEFAAENQPSVQIIYRLPRELPPPPDLTSPGSMVLIDRSTPGGPGRQLIVSTDGLPLLGEVWLKSPGPLTVALGPGLQLRQRQGPTEGIHDVPVEVVQNAQGQVIPVRAVTAVKAPAGVLQIFVQASYVANSSDPTGQYEGG